jgi:threonyl-tRNA synthetase
MSIDFVIIPASKELEEHAYNIKEKLDDSVFLVTNFKIDTNFNVNLNSRINKWKKDEFDIIVITPEFIENNSIVVRFSDKGSRLTTMDLQEFIDLVSSFEDDENHENEQKEEKEEKDDSLCNIM